MAIKYGNSVNGIPSASFTTNQGQGTNYVKGNADVDSLNSVDVTFNETARISAEERAKIVPRNIVDGVTILGVTGTAGGGGGGDDNTLVVNLTVATPPSEGDEAHEQEVSIDATYEDITDAIETGKVVILRGSSTNEARTTEDWVTGDETNPVSLQGDFIIVNYIPTIEDARGSIDFQGLGWSDSDNGYLPILIDVYFNGLDLEWVIYTNFNGASSGGANARSFTLSPTQDDLVDIIDDQTGDTISVGEFVGILSDAFLNPAQSPDIYLISDTSDVNARYKFNPLTPIPTWGGDYDGGGSYTFIRLGFYRADKSIRLYFLFENDAETGDTVTTLRGWSYGPANYGDELLELCVEKGDDYYIRDLCYGDNEVIIPASYWLDRLEDALMSTYDQSFSLVYDNQMFTFNNKSDMDQQTMSLNLYNANKKLILSLGEDPNNSDYPRIVNASVEDRFSGGGSGGDSNTLWYELPIYNYTFWSDEDFDYYGLDRSMSLASFWIPYNKNTGMCIYTSWQALMENTSDVNALFEYLGTPDSGNDAIVYNGPNAFIKNKNHYVRQSGAYYYVATWDSTDINQLNSITEISLASFPIAQLIPMEKAGGIGTVMATSTAVF